MLHCLFDKTDNPVAKWLWHSSQPAVSKIILLSNFQRMAVDGVWTVYTILMISALCTSSLTNYRGEEKHDIGTLAGDVQNWAMLIQNYILQVSSVYFTLLNFFIKSFGSGFIVYAVEITYYHNRAGRVQS